MINFDLIEEFDECELPNVEITENEKREIMNKVDYAIESLKNGNKEMDFNISVDDAMKIKEKLGDKVDNYIYGRKHALLMREIMIKTIEEEEGINEENIKEQLLVYIPASYWWRGGAICYKMYLINENRLIIYSFDSGYNVFSKYNIPVEEIKCAGEAGKAKKNMYDNEQVIFFKDTKIHLDPDYGHNKEEILNFIEALRKVGVPDVDRSGIPWLDIIYKIMCLLIGVGMLYSIVKLILK